MQRMVALVLTGLVLVLALAGCRPIVPEADSISVYATFYPIYALSEGVMRGVPNAELHCLVQPQDGCFRNYQLSDWDIALLKSGADAVISGGRGLESFEDTLFSWGNDGPAISAVLYNLELSNRLEKSVDSDAQSHLQGPNPHLYMSIDGAKQLVESISAMMISLDPDYSDLYSSNAMEAIEALDRLLESSRKSLISCMGQPVVLMSESLIYIAQDYDLIVADWIDREPGTAYGDNELAAWLDRLALADASVVLIEQQAPQSLVEALETAGYSVGRIDVLSTHTEGDGFDCYLEIQRNNAQAILGAFERAEAGKGEH